MSLTKQCTIIFFMAENVENKYEYEAMYYCSVSLENLSTAILSPPNNNEKLKSAQREEKY